jgi:predicted nucleic acid-binding Zn ribbon protein
VIEIGRGTIEDRPSSSWAFEEAKSRKDVAAPNVEKRGERRSWRRRSGLRGCGAIAEPARAHGPGLQLFGSIRVVAGFKRSGATWLKKI